MSEENENVMPDLLDLQEFDEEALKKESEEVLQMKFLTSENAAFRRTEGRTRRRRRSALSGA